jgi:DNA-binding MarR family transcriptional regulator
VTKRQRKSINFRVHALASSLFKGAQQYYGARFGVGLPELRILSNLDSEGPLAASRLVDLTAMDKALVSRILNTLHASGLLEASAPASDPRRRCWALSRSGHQLVEQLRPLWKQREAVIQSSLSAAERDLLEELLHRLFLASETLRAAEAQSLGREMARPAKKPAKTPRAPRGAQRPAAP